VDTLAFAAAFDEAGIGQDFQVMGYGGGGDTVESDKFAADHFFFGGDSLEYPEAGGVRQSL